MFSRNRDDFPTLRGDHAPAYLDNACVTLKPQSVIDAIHRYYTETPGCGGRSVTVLERPFPNQSLKRERNPVLFSTPPPQMKLSSLETPHTPSIKSLTA